MVDVGFAHPLRKPAQKPFCQKRRCSVKKKIREKRPEMLQLRDIAACRCAQGHGTSILFHQQRERRGRRRDELSLTMGFRTACKTLLLFS
jgi:hypothetical protein